MTLARGAAVAAVIAAVVLAGFVLLGRGGGYRVTAEFVDAGQLVNGNQVKVAGTPVGSVEGIEVSQNGRALVELRLDDDYAPLRRGTRAIVKQASLSGIANRYVDLHLGPQDGDEIEDGGRLSTSETSSAVELDQVFDLFDPGTRRSVRRVVRGSATMLRGRGAELSAGVRQLSPALTTGSRLFRELTRDERLLTRFLIDSSRLTTALAEREDDLTGAVRNLNATTRALGNQQAALGESIERLPPVMRRANTTFVNLRNALDDVDPLVAAARPAARRLGPFLENARGFAADAEPTVRDLQVTLRRGGRSNDLTEWVSSFPPLARTALDPRRVNGAVRRGAFPETSEALRAVAPTVALGRPYTNDLLGWLDDFSATGAYDALGGFSRAWINFSEILFEPGPKLGQFRRCPGANEEAGPDGTNVFSAAEQRRLGCVGSQRSVGP